MRPARLVRLAFVFVGGFALVPVSSAPPPARRIAVTIDDLPFVDHGLPLADVRAKTAALLAVLKARAVPAVGFVNEGKLQVKGERDARVALLEAWLDAGLELGNHTYSHADFQTTPLRAMEAEVTRGEVVTRALVAARGGALRWFRHPYTHTGPTRKAKAAFEAFLASRGYAVAPFTVEHADYLFARVYADARRANDAETAARVRAAYLDHSDTLLDWFEGLARELFGREIPQVLLTHANELNADALDELLGRLVRRGYAFVSLSEALSDPAYASPDGYVGPTGPSWLHRWRAGRGLPSRLREEPDPPAWARERFERRRAPN